MPGCAPGAKKQYKRLNIKPSKDGKFHMGLNDSNLVVVPGRAAQDGIHLWDEVVEVNGIELEDEAKLAEVLKEHAKEWADREEYEFVVRRRKEKELPEGHPDIEESMLQKIEGAPAAAKEEKKKSKKKEEKAKSKKGKDDEKDDEDEEKDEEEEEEEEEGGGYPQPKKEATDKLKSTHEGPGGAKLSAQNTVKPARERSAYLDKHATGEKTVEHPGKATERNVSTKKKEETDQEKAFSAGMEAVQEQLRVQQEQIMQLTATATAAATAATEAAEAARKASVNQANGAANDAAQPSQRQLSQHQHDLTEVAAHAAAEAAAAVAVAMRDSMDPNGAFGHGHSRKAPAPSVRDEPSSSSGASGGAAASGAGAASSNPAIVQMNQPWRELLLKEKVYAQLPTVRSGVPLAVNGGCQLAASRVGL